MEPLESKGTSAKKPKIVKLTEDLLKRGRDLLKAATTHLTHNVWSKLILIFVLVFLGLLLISLRTAIFYLIPPTLVVVVPLTVGLDALLTFFSAEFAIISIAWHFIHDAVKFVDPFSDFPVLGGPPKFKLYKITPHQMSKAIKEFAVTCAPYDSVSSILGRSFQVFLGPVVCPILRYVYPVPWLYNTLHFLVGWMSPDPTPAGFDGENNCKDDPSDFSWPCAAVGVGYIVFEVLLPLLILFILVETLLLPSLRFVYTVIDFHFYLGGIATDVAIKLVKGVDRKIATAAVERRQSQYRDKNQ